jgi:TetR/AcrR family transcriptional repressor of nem operon
VPFDDELLISFFSCLQSSLFAFSIDYGYNPFSDFDSHRRALVTDFFWGAMRHSKAEKAKTHERIVAIASKRFREEGLAGIGIADLMKEAGLTVGGFYKHFNSRDALVAEAVGLALELWKRQMDAAASGRPPVTYESLVDEYLSEAHLNHPGMGCPIGALAGDLARSDKRTRALVSRKIRDNIELLATLIRNANKADRDSARSQAVVTYCALVGAIGMARAVSDEQLTREILKTVAQRLKNPAS